tara:strand:- start:110 stop:901 length:792 start_codon:yes stop_codon:yes gene_type:complete
MKKCLIVFFVSFIFSQGGAFNFSLIGHLPRGEFKEELKNDSGNASNGWGIDFNGIYYINNYFGIGINGGNTVYGVTRRNIPFSYYTGSAITIEEETRNNIGYGHIFFKTVPFQTRVRPYFEGLIGLKNLYTTTQVNSENCYDDPDTEYDECEIAKSTNSSDYVFSYGLGVGFEVILIESSNSNSDHIQQIEHNYNEDVNGKDFDEELSFIFSFRYLYGDEAQYLKAGSIEYTDPENGPVQTSFNWSNSMTDLIQINIGLQVKF